MIKAELQSSQAAPALETNPSLMSLPGSSQKVLFISQLTFRSPASGLDAFPLCLTLLS